jgi:carboxypeptidase family protein
VVLRLLTAGVLVALLMPRAAAAAQTNTAEIAGVVRDGQGGVLPGATVTALHAETGFREERTADENGRYRLTALPVGRYALTVSLAGFARIAREDEMQLGLQLMF